MPKNLLEIKSLSVKVEGNKTILDNLDFHIESGRIYILFGPNGSGKTTLISTIAGMPGYKVTQGSIVFEGKDITGASVDARARMGIRTAFQLPPEIVGVKLADLLKVCAGKSQKEKLSRAELKLIDEFNMTGFLDRDINVAFSGGEKKRAEMLQMILMRPKLMLIDEPDSGVDIQTLGFLGAKLNDYIKESGSSALIITHQGDILNHIKAYRGCVLMNKRIACMGDPIKVLHAIREHGYQGCRICRRPMRKQ